ncbi:MAG TPA: ribosome silencing factor [Blastocatellia bacterium]|jgi:ribosome-associated protein|nr:ribosome silencing factor [Blastocatellia bacterium]
MGRTANRKTSTDTIDTLRLVEIAASAASEKKASDIVALDLREVASFTEYFLICTGQNQRQVQAISNSVEEELRKVPKRPLHIEGYSTGEWILLDYGDFIVHVLSNTARRFYDLERLWRDAALVKLP